MENNVVKQMQTVIPTTKVGLQRMAVDMIQQLEDGDVDALELLKTFKMVEKLQEMVKEKMMKAAVDLVEKYPEKDVELHGVTFKKIEAGTKYDYSNCNYSKMKMILEAETKLKEEKKKTEDFLKAIDGSMIIEDVDVDTAEVINVTVYPPVKTSTTSVQVMIK